MICLGCRSGIGTGGSGEVYSTQKAEENEASWVQAVTGKLTVPKYETD